MKKLVVFLTVFTLITASVAADVNLGGSFELMAHLARGETWNDNDPRTAMERDMNISIGAETPDGRFGTLGTLVRNTNFWVYAWWKPVDLFMIKMGSIFEDSTWAEADIAGEGLAGPHANKLNVKPTLNYAGSVLPSSTGFFTPAMTDLQQERALQLSFYPIEGLAVNFAFPMDRSQFNNMAEYNYIYKMHIQAAYAIGDVGEAAVAFINAPESADEFKSIFAQWKMPLGDSMRLELGFNLGFNSEATAPLNIGLGFGWGNPGDDRLVVNVRAGASVAMEDNQATCIGVDLVPMYDFDFMRLYVAGGLGVIMPAEGDTKVHWSFNPYIAKNLGGPFFYAGFQLYSSTVADGMDWSIPLGFRWDF